VEKVRLSGKKSPAELGARRLLHATGKIVSFDFLQLASGDVIATPKKEQRSQRRLFGGLQLGRGGS
jgi:hypothetical protein